MYHKNMEAFLTACGIFDCELLHNGILISNSKLKETQLNIYVCHISTVCVKLTSQLFIY